MSKVNEAKIKTHIHSSINLLKKLNLVKDLNSFNIENLDFKTKFSKEFLEIVYDDDYRRQYDTAMDHCDYDILLNDESFFQFSFLNKKDKLLLKYSYYPNPYKIEPFEDFEKKYVGNSEENLRDLYDQVKIEANIKSEILYFRYDFESESYEEIVHPFSHLHIGIKEDSRIPINYLLLPDLFVEYILFIMYVDKVKELVKDAEFLNTFLAIKAQSLSCMPELLKKSEKDTIYIN